MKVGLTLAGGGLQGFSHIGAIKALEELGINIEFVSGTSTGSLVAALYAMGYNAKEMETILKKEYKQILKFKKRVLLKLIINYILHKDTRTEGIVDGNIVSDLVNKVAFEKGVKSIKDINNKKLVIATVDTITMKECVFTSEKIETKEYKTNYIEEINIGDAVRASMSFPAIFNTFDFNKYNFIDGGTIDNLPARFLKEMGADKIISVSFDLNKYQKSLNLEGVITRALDIFSCSSVEEGRRISDISVEIYNKNTSLIDMDDFDKTLENGYNAIMNNKDKILQTFKEK